MKKKNAKNNINWKIAQLEAECGKVAQVSSVNKIQYAKLKHKGVDPKEVLKQKEVDPEIKKTLKVLNKQKQKQLLHKEIKNLKKLAKEVKAFESRKLVRRLKKLRAEAEASAAGDVEKVKGKVAVAEEELEVLKALSVEDISHFAVKSSRSTILMEALEQTLKGYEPGEPVGLVLHILKRICGHARMQSKITDLREDFTSAVDRQKRKRKKKLMPGSNSGSASEPEPKRSRLASEDYVSGSVSDSDAPPPVLYGPDGEPLFVGSLKDMQEDDMPVKKGPNKKNRPGQRARQALAEKKYGTEAAHIKNPKKKKAPEGGKKTGKGPVAPTPRGREVPEEKVHPSWEAKKENAAKLAAMANVKPSVRVAFDSDSD